MGAGLAVQQYPEIGQQVRARNRMWVVTDVRENSLEDRWHPLVNLLSVEDDTRDDTLQVVLDLEPRANASGEGTLPEVADFDPPERLDAFLDAVRWNAIASADVQRLQSPFRASITIEDYQFTPVN